VTLALAEDSLARLEAAVDTALVRADEGDLRVLGYGEISLVVAWDEDAAPRACKRLPPFADEDTFERYRGTVAAYLEALAEAGVPPVETAVQAHRRDDGRLVGYCVQPILPPGSLLPDRLRAMDEPDAVALFERVLGRITGGISPALGIDAQISNWAQVDGELLYLDISTPLMRDEAGAETLDTSLFLASLPWALRPLVRWIFLRAILDKYYDPRGAVVDLIGNLYKEQLEGLVPAFLQAAAAQLQPAITEAEVVAYYKEDARMWALLQVLRQADRWWQRSIRRRTYPFLLPGRIKR
jgi:Family of unknown function (DUF6206)